MVAKTLPSVKFFGVTFFSKKVTKKFGYKLTTHLFGYTNQKRSRQMAKYNKLLLIICAAFVLAIGSLIFILPQKNFSESENRYLSKLPNFSITSLLNGNLAKEISSFYTDQFPARQAATSTYALCELSLGKRNVGGVIKYRDKLISIPKKQTAKSDLPILSVCVKSKYELFKAENDELAVYYNTDHHRTTYGAYQLYLEACKKLNVLPYPESYFNKQTVCTDFYGTDFSKSRLPRFTVKSDSIELWRYDGDENVTLTVHDTNYTSHGFYNMSKLASADKYAVFLGGNYARATVFSTPEKPTVLLYKDSFANAVIPFLALHFNIDIIDPRYATPSQISSAYANPNYSHRLFIGCLESFG